MFNNVGKKDGGIKSYNYKTTELLTEDNHVAYICCTNQRLVGIKNRALE